MNSYYYTYLVINLIALLCALVRFKKADTAMRIVCLFLFLNLLFEGVAAAAAWWWHNNLLVYNLYSLFGFTLLCLYFNDSIDLFRKSGAGYLIAIGGNIGSILNYYLLQFKQLNINSIVFQSVIIIGAALFSITRLLLTTPSNRLLRNPHLWVNVLLAFAWSAVYFYLALYAYFQSRDPKSADLIVDSQNICNTVTYLAFSLIFLFLVPFRRAQS